MAAGVPITDVQRQRIRKMRAEGYTQAQTARALGVSAHCVHDYAPGYTGKVANDRLRQAFLESGVSAADVARELGWYQGIRLSADTSRVRRTLGLLETTNGQGRHQTRRLIDWETGSLIAEAIGVAAWSVLDSGDESDPRLEGEAA